MPLRATSELTTDLASREGEHLISIFIPTEKRGPEIEQNRIRFKNAIATADDMLSDAGLSAGDRELRLESPRALEGERDFWEHQGRGLACYIDDEGNLTLVALHRPPNDQTVVVASRFMLRPLMDELNDTTFDVLALTPDEVRLYRSTPHDTVEVDADLPDFDTVNWFTDREQQRQQHPDRAGSQRNRHGHAPGSDEDLNRFFRAVVEAVGGEPEEPLLVLGDDDLVARFDHVSDRPTSSPDNSGLSTPLNPDDVHRLVQPLLADKTTESNRKTIEWAEARLGQGEATTDLADAVRQAVSGRIDHVVYHRAAPPVWGTVDPSSLEVSIHDQPEIGDVDLIDRLIVLATGTGARFTPVEGEVAGHPFVAAQRF